MRTGVAVAVVLLVGVVGVVLWYVVSANNIERRLRSVADEFRVPSDFELVGRSSGGTTFCVISCTGRYELVVMVTDLPPSRAYNQLTRETSKQYGPLEYADYFAPQGDYIAIPDLGRAYIRMLTEFVNVARRGLVPDYVLPFLDELDGQQTVAWLLFDSGIDASPVGGALVATIGGDKVAS